MTKTIERTRNTNDATDVNSGTAINSSTSTTIAVANANRTAITISNIGPNAVWIKEQAASVDNDKKGVKLLKNGTAWNLPDTFHTGEYSAIADVGSATIFVTEG